MTSQPFEGQDVPDFEMLDARMASASKMIITNQHSRRVGAEEQNAQKYDRFLRGWHIAYMIYDHFRATGAHDAVLVLVSLQVLRQRFRYKMAPCSAFCKRSTFRKCLGEFAQDENTRVCSAFKQCWLCTTRKLIETEQCHAIKDRRLW